MVERQQVGDELRRPVEVEQPAPELARRLGGRRDDLLDRHRPLAGAGLPVLCDPVERVAGRLAVELEQRAVQRAAAPARRVVERACASPTTPCCARTSPAAARRPARRAAGNSRRLVRGRAGEPSRAARTARRTPLRSRASVDRTDPRGEPVAEAAVDRRLGRPQVRGHVAARAAVLELRRHQRRQHAAAAVRRQHADDGDAAGRDRAAARHRHAGT